LCLRDRQHVVLRERLDMEVSALRRGVSIAMAILAVEGVALAAPSAADRETARTLMDQGRDLRDKGDLKEAVKRFQAANDIMHVPTTALELVKTQVALKMLVEARDTVATMRQNVGPKEGKLFKDARAAAEEIDASLGARVPSVTINVKGTTPGQDVTLAIDGVEVPSGVIGLPRTIDPGHHVITAKTSTGQGQQEIDVAEAESKPVDITVAGDASAAPPPTDVTPTGPDEAPERSHSPTKLTYIGIGVTGAGILMGTITGIVSISDKSSLAKQCLNDICGPSSSSALSSANTMATLSDVGFAVAGAGAVFTAVTLILGHDKKPDGAAPATDTPPSGDSAPPSTSSPADTPPAPSAFRVVPWFSGTMGGLVGTF
jgi:hypothetical protein